MKILATIIAIVVFSLTLLFSQDEFTTRKIAVFKNGTGFFIKSGKVDAPDGKYILKSTPTALFGTMWINSLSTSIKSIFTLKEKSVEVKDAENIKQMLTGNINKKIRVVMYDGSAYDATIMDVKNDIVTFAAKEKWVVTDISQVRTIEFYEKPELTYEMKTNANQIAIEFATKGKNDLYIMYLQKGIGWFPSYLVEIGDGDKANLTLRSTLINDVEDIRDAEISFVVGVPNFRYSYVESPLTSDQDLQSFINSLNYGAYGSMNSFDNSGVMSNAIMTQAISNVPASMTVPMNDSEFSAEVSNQEDLYFYKHTNVTIEKGSRATYDLLNTKVPFEHIYEVTLTANAAGGYYYSNTYNDENINKVWHSLKLKNSTNMPWTTGTAMVVKKSDNSTKPISQDMLKYTPVGSDSYLKITISPDITVKDKDKEVSRIERSKKRNSDYYDLVTVEGSIVVKNYKDSEVKLNIKRNVSGDLKESNVKWEFTKLPASYYYYINPTNEVNWELILKSGEEKEINYSYTIYVYH
ncbi:MAG: hypothetical protein ABIJ97_18130 [Bacteroidota bacterium]